MTRQAVRDARSLIFGLRPLVLETKGLLVALEQYLEQLRESDSFTAYHLMAENFDRRLGLHPQVARVIFAILQEAINNARKHARAKNVTVRLRYDREVKQIETAVEDDGTGFDLERVEEGYDQRYSFGLVNMRERASLIEGVLRIESEVGKGTRVELIVPWREAQE
jgi:signal transduction histidine kinase